MTVSEQIREILNDEKDFKMKPRLSDEESLLEAGVVDSFGMITLIVLLEKRFDVKVAPKDMSQDHFRSIASIAKFIEGKTA